MNKNKTIQPTLPSETECWAYSAGRVLQEAWENESDETMEKYLAPVEKKKK